MNSKFFPSLIHFYHFQFVIDKFFLKCYKIFVTNSMKYKCIHIEVDIFKKINWHVKIFFALTNSINFNENARIEKKDKSSISKFCCNNH